jgi:protein transport protein SEC24
MGPLKNREDVKILGTDKEKQLFEPQEYFWKKLGQECAVNGVNVDSYFFPTAYIDLATIGALSALSGGDCYMYSQFDANRNGVKFANDFQRTLARTFGYDALLRVRVSTGVKVADYFGNLYMKNPTDVELAGIDSLKAIGVLLQHDGKLDERQDVYIQAALLYTTQYGQRRVRVHNLSLGIASQLSTVFKSAEMDTTLNLIMRQTVQKAFLSPLKNIRDQASQRCIKILTAYRTNCAANSSSGQLILPEALKLMPLYTLCLLKSRAFRGGKPVHPDARVYTMRLINQLGVPELVTYVYPTLYDVSLYDPMIGELNEHNLTILPPVLRVSADRMNPAGVYLAGTFNLHRKRAPLIPLDWTRVPSANPHFAIPDRRPAASRRKLQHTS